MAGAQRARTGAGLTGLLTLRAASARTSNAPVIVMATGSPNEAARLREQIAGRNARRALGQHEADAPWTEMFRMTTPLILR